jgi:branched-chain amino acid transport system permease protein
MGFGEDLGLNLLFAHFVNGLSRAMILFTVAAGLSILLGVLRIPNFAHGSLYMLGAYLFYTIGSKFANNSVISFFIGIIMASLGVALLSLLIERGLLRILYKKESFLQFMLLYGLVIIISDLVKLIWGVGYKTLPPPPFLRGFFQIFSMQLSRYNLFLIIVGLITMGSIWFLVNRTKMGKISRAAAVDREMVGGMGINVSVVFGAVFVIGGWLAGLSGALIAPIVSLDLGMDISILIKSFLIVISGGMGNIWGVFIVSIMFGLTESYAIMLFPAYVTPVPFALALIILIFRPSGLLKPIW